MYNVNYISFVYVVYKISIVESYERVGRWFNKIMLLFIY